MKITITLQRQRPARVLRKGVKHMVQKSNSRVDIDALGSRDLSGVLSVLVVKRLKGTSVERDRDLNLSLVGVTVDGGGAAGHFCGWRAGWWGG